MGSNFRRLFGEKDEIVQPTNNDLEAADLDEDGVVR